MSLFISLHHNLEYEVTSNNFTFSLTLQNLLFQGWNHMPSQNPASTLSVLWMMTDQEKVGLNT